MTKEQAKQHLARNALLMFEHNGTSTLDGDATLELIDKIYDNFEEELKKAYIEGSNANYKAMKKAGKLK